MPITWNNEKTQTPSAQPRGMRTAAEARASGAFPGHYTAPWGLYARYIIPAPLYADVPTRSDWAVGTRTSPDGDRGEQLSIFPPQIDRTQWAKLRGIARRAVPGTPTQRGALAGMTALALASAVGWLLTSESEMPNSAGFDPTAMVLAMLHSILGITAIIGACVVVLAGLARMISRHRDKAVAEAWDSAVWLSISDCQYLGTRRRAFDQLVEALDALDRESDALDTKTYRERWQQIYDQARQAAETNPADTGSTAIT